MDTMENPALEPRSERIARYKAERRRELQERYGNMEELPSKWVRRDGTLMNSDGAPPSTDRTLSGGVNGRAGGLEGGRRGLHWESSTPLESEPRRVSNGFEADTSADPTYLQRQCSSGSAGMLSGGKPLAPPGPPGPDSAQLQTRVSVGQLRSALLQQTGTGTQPEKVSPDSGLAASSLDLAVKPGSEGGRRRTRRYLPGVSGGGRKTNERFRTQPITACEVQESGGLLEAEEEENAKADVKTDDRAKMSVAAKIVRRGNEHRSLTQPITCEEMVVATSTPQPAESGEAKAVQAEAEAVEDDENSKLTMSEKLALFNKLSLPGSQGDAPPDAPPERRRQKGARYRTQPITVEEVSLLQKGPIQLPPLRLSPTLSDRQQELSVNLRPFEVHQAQTRPEADVEPNTGPDPSQQGLQQRWDSEPGEIRGILMKSPSAGPEWDPDRDIVWEDRQQDQNGGGERGNGVEERRAVRHDNVPVPRRERPASSAPWRQRNRNRRETVAMCAPARPSSEQGHPQEERPSLAEQRGQMDPPVNTSGRDRLSDASREEEEEERGSLMRRDTPPRQHVQVTLADQRKDPVFSSVYSNSTPQYVMCYNQTISSYEAQEVSSPTQTRSQPQWRQKQARPVEVEELPQASVADRMKTLQEKISSHPGMEVEEDTKLDKLDSFVDRLNAAPQDTPLEVTSREVKEVMTPDDQETCGGFYREVSPPSPSARPAGAGAATGTDPEQDLSALCQTNTPMLTSEVAQHRRSVRPYRRTQGSRNPLRALAARDDIRQNYMGERASELASLIQTQGDLGCRACEVIHLEEGVNTDNSLASDFWNLLGGKTQYRGAGAPEEDELYESGVVESNCLYRLVENRLVPHEQAWAAIPTVSLLGSTEALVFDFGSEVYLWHGKDVAPGDRSVAVQLAQQVWGGPYDYSNCRTAMPVLPQHSPLPQQPQQHLECVSLCACDAKALVAGQGVAVPGDGVVPTVLEGVDVQRGHGVVPLEDGRQVELSTVALDTWHIQEFEDSEAQLESPGQLHDGDTYLVRWTYTLSPVDESGEPGKECSAVFIWQGRHSSINGRGTPALRSHEGTQVMVPQGQEPPCFLQLFQGGLVIHKGCRADTTNNTGVWRLFCVRGELPEEASLLEVDCSCGGLRSRGSLILLNSQQGALYLWHGCKVHTSSREAGKRAMERLTQMCPPELGLSIDSPARVQEVEEGAEPVEFWNAIGQQDRKAYDCMLQDPGKYNFTPRLFHLSTFSGTFQGEELQSPARLPGVVMAMPFVQESLYFVPQPALFLLDNHMELYLWQAGEPENSETAGSACIRWTNERRCAMQTRNPRRPLQAYLIQDGAEPLTFTNVFPRWEKRPTSTTQGEAGRVKLTLVQDALAQLTKTQYPLEELLQTPLPEGTILEMKRDEYDSLPNWKQITLKKSKGLY
ncbi:unnamed protein product [Coregonus sp. 'balchen']|nr:unnamed protein product [Coregonus sp. 'balchen']